MSTLVPAGPIAVLIPGDGRPTLAVLVPPFLTWLKLIRRRSDNTIAGYAFDLRRFLEFCGKAGVTSSDQVTFREIEMYLGWIHHEFTSKVSTANRHWNVLLTFWRWLSREGHAARNPVAATLPLKQPGRLPNYLSIPEQDRVIEVLGRGETPMRRRDYGLVGPGSSPACAWRSWRRSRCMTSTWKPACSAWSARATKERELPIVLRLAAILRDYLTTTRPLLVNRPMGCVYQGSTDRYRRAQYVKDGRLVDVSTRARIEEEARAFLARVGEQPPESPWVFVNADPKNSHRLHRGGQALLPRSLFYVVRNRVSAIVGRPVLPHVLRHRFASRLRENGAPLELIQEALGHASINTTMMCAPNSTAKRKVDLARFLA